MEPNEHVMAVGETRGRGATMQRRMTTAYLQKVESRSQKLYLLFSAQNEGHGLTQQNLLDMVTACGLADSCLNEAVVQTVYASVKLQGRNEISLNLFKESLRRLAAKKAITYAELIGQCVRGLQRSRRPQPPAYPPPEPPAEKQYTDERFAHHAASVSEYDHLHAAHEDQEMVVLPYAQEVMEEEMEPAIPKWKQELRAKQQAKREREEERRRLEEARNEELRRAEEVERERQRVLSIQRKEMEEREADRQRRHFEAEQEIALRARQKAEEEEAARLSMMQRLDREEEESRSRREEEARAEQARVDELLKEQMKHSKHYNHQKWLESQDPDVAILVLQRQARRIAAKHLVAQLHEEEVENFHALLDAGLSLILHKRRGDPRAELMTLEHRQDGVWLTWGGKLASGNDRSRGAGAGVYSSKGKKKHAMQGRVGGSGVKLVDVFKVKKGAPAYIRKTLPRGDDGCFFSLLTADRSVDLEAQHYTERNEMVRCFTRLIQEKKEGSRRKKKDQSEDDASLLAYFAVQNKEVKHGKQHTKLAKKGSKRTMHMNTH